MLSMRLLFVLLSLLTATLVACGGGSSSAVDDPTPVLTLQSAGQVVDEQGAPVAGATVAVLSGSTVPGTDASASTGSDGRFALALDAATPAVLRVQKTGYASSFRAAATAASNASVGARVVLLPVATTLGFDATQAAVLRVPGSPARVELAANSLVREDGQAISGATTVALTPIDPSADIGRMPGLMVDAVSGDPIESLGALTLSFTDATGASLNLASGQVATIRIPATPAAGAVVPATFPLYHLNETNGRWTQEGIATLKTDPATGAAYYEGTVSHFSTWNADRVMVSASLDLEASQGGTACPLAVGLRVLAVGLDYNAFSQAEAGRLLVRANSRVQMRLVDGEGTVLDAFEFNTNAVGATDRLPRCLAPQATVQLSGRVGVSSGSLAGYRVQISGGFDSFTLPLDAQGRYSTPIYRSAGPVSARLVRTDTRRDLPDTAVSATVAGSDLSLPDLTVADTRVQFTGCLQGWAGYRQSSAQVSVLQGSRLLAPPFTASATAPDFVFSVPVQSSLSLRITPPDASLAERTVALSVGSGPLDLGACLALPRGPQVQASSSGSGLVRSFDATATTPGDAPLTTFAWDFGDGSSGSGLLASHTYASAGTFTVRLTVSDALGQQSVFSLTPEAGGGTVYSTLTPATTLDAGGRHACVILGGSPWCWGNNSGQNLGRSYGFVTVGGSNIFSGLESSGVPVQASVGITSATAVAGGDTMTCALLASGTVQCWGVLDTGGLGDGVSASSVVPVTVSGIGTAKALSSGADHVCAVLDDGTVRCWGDKGNVAGATQVPQTVNGVSNAARVVASGAYFSTGGLFSCALLADGGVRCWGDNRYGKLGNGSLTNSAVPVTVNGISTAVEIAASDKDVCVLQADGSLACWGEYSGGVLGQLGVTAVAGGPPVTVPGVANAVALAMSITHSCALLADGTVACWGGAARARGVTSPALTSTAALVPGLSGVVSIAVGNDFTCALLASGSVQCLGSGANGVLGTGGEVFRVDGVVQNPPSYPSSITPLNVVGLP
jgi:alpha-tubulin suppressor-like RCC1 family protein